MRDLFLLVVLIAILVRTLGAVQAGILGWTWLTLMKPQELAWGAVLPLNFVLAAFTILAWIVSREPKKIPINGAIVLWFVFTAFITFTTFFSLAPDPAWAQWQLTIKVMILGLFVTSIMTNEVRIHSLVWIAALSLGYFGVKGGIFTLITGGRFHVMPVASFGDNNNLALVLCMVLPLMNYLRMHAAHRYVRVGIVIAMVLTAIAILGTYSRGGLVGLGVMLAYLWWHSANRLAIALAVMIVAFPAYKFMPANWVERMGTIESAGEDSSFQGRLDAWKTALNLAKARPLTGGGFGASMSAEVTKKYGDDPNGWPRAAHSIYFQVLGDHGFIGLALYLAMLIVTWGYAGSVRRRADRVVELKWIADLARMIQVSLVAFMTAGAALSMAYYDLFFLLLGMTVALRELVIRSHVGARSSIDSALSIGSEPLKV